VVCPFVEKEGKLVKTQPVEFQTAKSDHYPNAVYGKKQRIYNQNARV